MRRLRDEEAERMAMLEAIAEAIRRRAATPDDEFVDPHGQGDFTKILERLLAERDMPG